MSQGVPPTLQGQEDGPNPLEIFYEKNKKWLILLLVLLVAGTAANYGLDAMNAAKRNSAWAEVTRATGLGSRFGTKMELTEMQGEMQKWQAQIWGFTINNHHAEQISALMKDLKDVDQVTLDNTIKAAAGEPHEPLLMWVSANKAYAEERFADAKAACEQLQSKFPKHLLCSESAHPPQALEEKEETEEEKKERLAKRKKGEAEDPVSPRDKEYKDPKKGSPVGNLLAAIAKDQAFRSSHEEYFTDPKPNSANKVTITLKSDEASGDVEIQFFDGVAPNHVKAFLQLVVDGHFTGMRVHEMVRPGEGKEETQPRTIHIGHPDSKETEIAKWRIAPKVEDDQMLEFEESKLSFFPGMVAFETEKNGEKSSARRFFIAVNDCAATHDGEHVVFARVVKGLELLQTLNDMNFQTADEDKNGKGIPGSNILLEKVVATGPGVPKPTPKKPEKEDDKGDGNKDGGKKEDEKKK